MKKYRFLTVLWFICAAVALLAIGALQAWQAYQLRGIPESLPQPTAFAGVQPGLNVYLNQYDDAQLTQTLDEIAALGFRYVKQSFYFSEDFDWAAADRIVTAVSERDLMLVPLLDGNPNDQFAPPTDTAVFAAWAQAFATRYGDDVQYYIIWDEPNITTHWGNQAVNPAEYGALLTETSQAIRSVDGDAVIVLAPLAPTIETGPQNLADPLYLQELYEAGVADAFDIVMGKPYGFDASHESRETDIDATNFNRAILLREVMVKNGDDAKAVWAGNWGWNALPDDWSGRPSIWGSTDEHEQAHNTIDGLKRARAEWPWMGVMFLENWEPDALPDDPVWGFSIAGRETAEELGHYLAHGEGFVAWPGFHFAEADGAGQAYDGGWRFSPEFGADVSPHPDDELFGDKVTFTFWGTDLGLMVRRADFRARFYVTIDGEPANAIPQDEHGAVLVLTAPTDEEAYLSLEPIAENLEPGIHVAEIVTSRGWDQWALNGFSVGYAPPMLWLNWAILGLFSLSLLFFGLCIYSARKAGWGVWFADLRDRYRRLDNIIQIALTFGTAVIVTIAGWLTWADQMGGIYRRLGDGSQLAITAVAAGLFYVSPSFIITVIALLVLFVLIYLRPAWGLALITFCFPFYVQPVLKPIFQFRFSPIEIFTLITFAAFLLNQLTHHASRITNGTWQKPKLSLKLADWTVLILFVVATLSLFFTERLDVATNEWRMVIFEPVLFYLVLRGVKPTEKEMWVIFDALVASGLVIALYGLYQYGFDRNSLITAEGGLLRIKSIYGSPNNVALYLGRIIPFLVAMFLLGSTENGKRRWGYTIALLPIGLVTLLTFSKGAIFLGLPAALLFIFWQWQKQNGRKTWPWVILFAGMGVVGLFVIEHIPAIAGRLGLFGETGIFRLNLWQSSLNMIRENPLFGVGLDNFLYEYRGRYIFEAAWRDPNLSHPHNIFLDFGTRLGLLGLATGLLLIFALIRTLWKSWSALPKVWFPIAVGLAAALIDMVAHGLVDHSFFLVDLAFFFMLILGTAVWLWQQIDAQKTI